MKYRIPFFYDYVFPNFILPNAVVAELGIINYIHSMYSNKHKHNSFFDIESGDVNPLISIFGRNLGSWPNSVLPGHQLNLHAHCYREKLELYEEAIVFGKKNCRDKYIYPIRLSYNLSEFAASDLPNGVKLNGEYFWKCMSAEALLDAQLGKSIIFLDYGQENYIDKENFVRLHTALEKSNIPKENIVLALNTFNGEEVYNSMFEESEQKLTVKNWPFVVVNTSYHYVLNTDQRVDQEEFENSRSRIRNNYFLFKIRRAREHRLILLYCLASAGILEKSDWSCLSDIDFNEAEIKKISQLVNLDIKQDKIIELHKNIPHSLQSERETYEAVGPWNDKHPTPYKDSYFYVCSETFVHGDFKSLTEKIFKPIVNFQPFLFLAYKGALATLHNLGFKTFHPYIDESYDLEPDENIRIRMIYDEINRLCSMSKQELHDWYWSMEELLVHNQQHALKLCQDENLTFNFIKYLNDRIK
jgi:hypothetical protein